MEISGITQFYTDVEKAMTTSMAVVKSKEVALLFNAHVKEAKATYPDDYVLKTLPDEIGDITIGSLLILCGQLRQAVASNINREKNREER